MKKIVCINGPNFNLMGRCQPEIYGTETMPEIRTKMADAATATGAELDFFQSNHQGEMIDRVHQALDDGTDGIIINPCALRHTSVALRDALLAVAKPTVEVHVTRVGSTEFRHESLFSPIVLKQVCGHGSKAYLAALKELLAHA
jgi:3-dehydroquinate dehydratase II